MCVFLFLVLTDYYYCRTDNTYLPYASTILASVAVCDTSRTPPPGHPNSRPPATPEPYAFRFPTRPLIRTPDSHSPHQRYVPVAPAGRTGNTEVRHVHLHRYLHRRCRDIHRRRLMTPTPLPPPQPIRWMGVGRSMEYVILGGLRFLHPVQVASRNGVLVPDHNAVAHGHTRTTSPIAHSQSRKPLCATARMGCEQAFVDGSTGHRCTRHHTAGLSRRKRG
ncbi:hypothetical protein PISMIDRAFT_424003 [Pisolithus microcarpus 441]|uniref:Uncharacterized protein n=1 Tax=Pisolithus microcarpus 441 TaxID=765257 RepID=A0A0C9XK92_9AGAM|nr:hypothetical protein PISMIDRAFT_424003 [Pisolithus microcarpus 441]